MELGTVEIVHRWIRAETGPAAAPFRSCGSRASRDESNTGIPGPMKPIRTREFTGTNGRREGSRAANRRAADPSVTNSNQVCASAPRPGDGVEPGRKCLQCSRPARWWIGSKDKKRPMLAGEVPRDRARWRGLMSRKSACKRWRWFVIPRQPSVVLQL